VKLGDAHAIVCTAIIASFFADAVAQHTGLGGLLERLAAVAGAAWIAFLAVGVSRRPRPGTR
jgi:hypothetical protein